MANNMAKNIKTAKQLERYFKGVANHRRIEILFLIEKNPGVSVAEIADTLEANLKTISEHTRRLVASGLVFKRYRGRTVEHSLSPYGKIFIRFIISFSHS